MTDFLKTVPTRNLTGFTRKKRSMHEGRRHTPSAIASSYASQQSRVSTFVTFLTLKGVCYQIREFQRFGYKRRGFARGGTIKFRRHRFDPTPIVRPVEHVSHHFFSIDRSTPTRTCRRCALHFRTGWWIGVAAGGNTRPSIRCGLAYEIPC